MGLKVELVAVDLLNFSSLVACHTGMLVPGFQALGFWICPFISLVKKECLCSNVEEGKNVL